MQKKIIFSIVLILFASILSAQDEYDVYLLIGQSNAVGFAPLESGDENVVDGVYLLDSLGTPVPCSGVANRFSSLPKLGNRMGYNLGVSFGKKMHEVTGRKILMVVNAKGNTSISQWIPTAEDPLFYNEAVRRTKQAQAYGTVKGILWHQGCGDARWTGQYAKRAKLLFESLRKDIGDEDIPVVVGEIGKWLVSQDGTVTADNINEVLRNLPYSIPNLLCVSSEGCTPIYDKIHFDHKSLELLGLRYADKMLSFGQGLQLEPGGTETSFFIAKQGWYQVYAIGNKDGFRIKINQQILSNSIDTADGNWTFAGRIYLKSGDNTLFLKDASCCKAVWISNVEGIKPPQR